MKKILTPAQIKVMQRFATTGTATPLQLRAHYSYWIPPIKALKSKGLVKFNTERKWWELTEKGTSFMPSVLEPEERKTMTKKEALELLKQKEELTAEQIETIRKALRNTEEEEEDEWSNSGNSGESWTNSY